MEILMALGLLNLVVLAATVFLVTVIQTNATSQIRSGALALAQEKIENLKTGPPARWENETESQVTTGNLKTFFDRETTVSRVVGEALVIISVRVSWPDRDGARRHHVELATQWAG